MIHNNQSMWKYGSLPEMEVPGQFEFRPIDLGDTEPGEKKLSVKQRDRMIGVVGLNLVEAGNGSIEFASRLNVVDASGWQKAGHVIADVRKRLEEMIPDDSEESRKARAEHDIRKSFYRLALERVAPQAYREGCRAVGGLAIIHADNGYVTGWLAHRKLLIGMNSQAWHCGHLEKDYFAGAVDPAGWTKEQIRNVFPQYGHQPAVRSSMKAMFAEILPGEDFIRSAGREAPGEPETASDHDTYQASEGGVLVPLHTAAA